MCFYFIYPFKTDDHYMGLCRARHRRVRPAPVIIGLTVPLGVEWRGFIALGTMPPPVKRSADPRGVSAAPAFQALTTR